MKNLVINLQKNQLMDKLQSTYISKLSAVRKVLVIKFEEIK